MMYMPTTAVTIAKTFDAIFFGILVSILLPSNPPPEPPITNSNEITMLIWFSKEYPRAVVPPNILTGISDVPIALPIFSPEYNKEGTIKNPPPIPK